MRAVIPRLALTLSLALAAAVPASAGTGMITYGAGGSGFRSAPNSGHFAMTYHHTPVIGPLRPAFGVLGSSVGDSFYYGGLSFDLGTYRGWGATPLFTMGFYNQGGGMDLGGPLEFRSGVEIFRMVGRQTRVGFSWHHISNAGLFDRNPGRESLFLSVGFLR